MKQPQGQKRLTNIATVRVKVHGLKFEVAWYVNEALATNACAHTCDLATHGAQLQEHRLVVAQPDVRAKTRRLISSHAEVASQREGPRQRAAEHHGVRERVQGAAVHQR